jgi:cytochrome c biogenesis protein CcdA
VTVDQLVDLLVEGVGAAGLPSSLLILVPGLAAVLASGERRWPTVCTFVASTTFVAWLRFSGRGGDWPRLAVALVLAAAAVLLALPFVHQRASATAAAASLAGASAAELWLPRVGPALGRLLADLAQQGPGAGIQLLAYVAGVLTPVVALAVLLRLLPLRIVEPAHRPLAMVAAGALGLLALATAAGVHDDLARSLMRWSLS